MPCKAFTASSVFRRMVVEPLVGRFLKDSRLLKLQMRQVYSISFTPRFKAQRILHALGVMPTNGRLSSLFTGLMCLTPFCARACSWMICLALAMVFSKASSGRDFNQTRQLALLPRMTSALLRLAFEHRDELL